MTAAGSTTLRPPAVAAAHVPITPAPARMIAAEMRARISEEDSSSAELARSNSKADSSGISVAASCRKPAAGCCTPYTPDTSRPNTSSATPLGSRSRAASMGRTAKQATQDGSSKGSSMGRARALHSRALTAAQLNALARRNPRSSLSMHSGGASRRTVTLARGGGDAARIGARSDDTGAALSKRTAKARQREILCIGDPRRARRRHVARECAQRTCSTDS